MDYYSNQPQVYNQPQGAFACPRCGSNNVNVQAVSEIQKRGCLSVLLIIILIFIPIIGWIAIFMILRGRKSKTVSYAVCQNCGNRWTV